MFRLDRFCGQLSSRKPPPAGKKVSGHEHENLIVELDWPRRATWRPHTYGQVTPDRTSWRMRFRGGSLREKEESAGSLHITVRMPEGKIFPENKNEKPAWSEPRISELEQEATVKNVEFFWQVGRGKRGRLVGN